MPVEGVRIKRILKSRAAMGLVAFIKEECSNFDRHYRKCLFFDNCKVMQGKQCGFFEQRVLGPHDYKYRSPGYDHQKLFAQYAQQTRAAKQKIKTRTCPDCGAPLSRRQRYCVPCSRKRARQAGRERQRKFRFSGSHKLTV